MAKKKDPPIVVGAVEIPVSFNPNMAQDEFGHFVKHGPNGPYIEYSSPKPDELKASVLFHESLHALSDLHGVELTEEQVLKLEALLPRLIVDNWISFRKLFLKLNQGKVLA